MKTWKISLVDHFLEEELEPAENVVSSVECGSLRVLLGFEFAVCEQFEVVLSQGVQHSLVLIMFCSVWVRALLIPPQVIISIPLFLPFQLRIEIEVYDLPREERPRG